MSFHNRLLLNRAMISGLRSIEVLLLLKGRPDGLHYADGSLTGIARLGGRGVRTEPEIGYLRIELPPGRLIELAASADIEAYQISSRSRGAWYRDTVPESNANMFRGFEVSPIARPVPGRDYTDLPELTPEEARAPGFTADADAGVGEWTKRNPTFDGRGVTIAVLETALPSFADPVFRTAKTLNGDEVPKVVGILNTMLPEQDDETRVRLKTVVEADRSWARVGNRTYVLPRPGKYRMGWLDVPAGANVVHQFAVIERDTDGEVWIDANGDASFQDETPLADVNERFEPRFLKVKYPQQLDVSFVMSRGQRAHVVHIYPGKSAHQSMTASVAAGNLTGDSLASGVAPNARLLFVRMHGAGYSVASVAEAFIQAAQRPDVDVLTSSTGLHLIPDTSADFVGLLFSRITATYGKPIINGGGNFGLALAHVQGYGGALSVGGTLGPATYAAFYGEPAPARMIVHPWSPAGPAIDGAIKPDFLAPTERIAATPPWYTNLKVAPQKNPARRVPPGYEISCCTSASSPYAAGIVALLVSAARQSNVTYSAETLNRALRVSARPVPGFQAHQQGHGAIDVNGAWRELTSRFEPPRIVASAQVVHPLARYAARGADGHGILEFGGWTAGMKGSRVITLRRESGPDEPVTYDLRWTAHDGTFSTAPSVRLPLDSPVPLRVDIDVRQPGAHSGLLTLHDRTTDAVVFRTQATIVATERIVPATGSLTAGGTVPNMGAAAHYLNVPPGAGGIALELEISRGVLWPTLVQSHGLLSSYYAQVHPMELAVGVGSYHLLMPSPEPGTWTVHLKNVSVKFPPELQLGPSDDREAAYTLRMRVLDASISAAAGADGVTLELINRGSLISAPTIDAYAGTRRTHGASFERSGLPHIVEITVPADASTLSLDLRSESAQSDVELFLYDCTTGECFSYDVAFPAAQTQKLVVRKPKAGRWVAAVNTAPFPTSGGGFTLDEIITTGAPIRRSSPVPRPPGARWREVFSNLPPPARIEGGSPVVVFELLDSAAERDEENHPWSSSPKFMKLRDRPVAIATASHPG